MTAKFIPPVADGRVKELSSGGRCEQFGINQKQLGNVQKGHDWGYLWVYGYDPETKP